MAWELQVASEAPARAAGPEAGDTPPARAASAPPDLPRITATLLARPLFSPTRRPPAQGVAAEAPPDLTLPRLAGVLVTSDGGKALFAGTPRPVVVRQGERLGHFVVRSIEPGEVIVQGPGGARALRPSFDPAPSAGQSFAAMPLLPAPPLPFAAKAVPFLPVPPPTGLADFRRQVSEASAGRESLP